MRYIEMDFRTDKEKARTAVWNKVVADFKKYKAETGYTDSRIMRAMAESGKYGYRAHMTIRKILISRHAI